MNDQELMEDVHLLALRRVFRLEFLDPVLAEISQPRPQRATPAPTRNAGNDATANGNAQRQRRLAVARIAALPTTYTSLYDSPLRQESFLI